MPIDPSEAVAVVAAMQEHHLSVDWWTQHGWVVRSQYHASDYATDGEVHGFLTVVEAVSDWLLRHDEEWPVMISELATR